MTLTAAVLAFVGLAVVDFFVGVWVGSRVRSAALRKVYQAGYTDGANSWGGSRK